jgi:hypothetical protein
MVVNRYTQAPVAVYNPMSMQELAFAPTFLRQRHDQAAQALSDLGIQSSQYDVLDQYAPVANQLVTPLQEQRSNAIPQAMKLKSEYANMFGAQGGIGQLQNRTAQYRQQAQAIDTFFKDAPELAQYMKARLNPGEAVLQDGRLQLGQIGTPTYVKDIPESEILKTLNTAAAGLKESDLGDFGLQGVVGVGDFDKIVTLASGKGVTAQRAMNLIQNLVGQDQWNSLYQRGAMMGLTPEETKKNFVVKLKGIATENAVLNVNRDRYKVTDEVSLAKAKKEAELIGDQSYEYDPYTKVIEPAMLDDSYFKPNYISPGAFSPYSGATGSFGVMPQGAGAPNQFGQKGNPNRSQYKPLSQEQAALARTIISEKTGVPEDRITGFDLNKSENRKILEAYYNENKDAIRITPKIENASLLREYGGKPEAASKDLMDNYISKQFIDAETRKPLTKDEISQLLSSGYKINVMGVYGTGAGFTTDAQANGIDPKAMSRPIAANIVDENGNIVKRVAASRPASHFESLRAVETTQEDLILDKVVTTPNIFRTIIFPFTRDQQGRAIYDDDPINIKVKFDSKKGIYEIKSANGEFNSFNTSDITNLQQQILQNVNVD